MSLRRIQRCSRIARSSLPSVVLCLLLESHGVAASPSEVDASDDAACPPGWYCSRPSSPEAAPKVEPPLPPRPRAFSRLGVGARLAWLPLPREASANAYLWGLGGVLRYRFARPAAVEFGVNTFTGRDYLGRERTEAHAESNLVLFPGKDSDFGPSASFGFDVSAADVEGFDFAPWYFGGHLGLGIATPREKPFGFGIEALGFVRERVDERAADSPDYEDPLTGQASNTSLGAVLRATATYSL